MTRFSAWRDTIERISSRVAFAWTDLSLRTGATAHALAVEELQDDRHRTAVRERNISGKDVQRVPVLIERGDCSNKAGNQGVAFVLDLTERKRAEEAVRESEEK